MKPDPKHVSEAKLRRDLDWLLSCPDLLVGPQSFPLEELRPEVDSLDLSPLRDFLSSNAWHRVGYYFETFVATLLRAAPSVEDVKHSTQIFDGKTTLGELDFLFQQDKKLTHLEIALKFYLHYEPEHDSGSHFMGPNAADNFEKKRQKLLGQQLPFGKEHTPEIESSRALVKGQIFYHPHQSPPTEWPELMNPNHRRGTWIRESELDFFGSFPDGSKGQILAKPFWLGAPEPEETIPIPELAKQLQTRFLNRKHPLLVSVLDTLGDESERIFVVSNSWPNLE